MRGHGRIIGRRSAEISDFGFRISDFPSGLPPRGSARELRVGRQKCGGGALHPHGNSVQKRAACGGGAIFALCELEGPVNPGRAGAQCERWLLSGRPRGRSMSPGTHPARSGLRRETSSIQHPVGWAGGRHSEIRNPKSEIAMTPLLPFSLSPPYSSFPGSDHPIPNIEKD